MKKMIAFVLILTFALCLFGCATTRETGKMQEINTEQGNISENKEGTSTETTDTLDNAEGETEDLSSGDIAGSVDEHGADQQQKQAEQNKLLVIQPRKNSGKTKRMNTIFRALRVNTSL